MNPTEFKPGRPEEFIGPARQLARVIDRIVQRSVPRGEPVRLFIQGDPGIGKSALLDYLVGRLAASKWTVAKFNGTQLTIERVEDYARSLAFTDLFGGYRILRIEEVDKANHMVQARMLTLLDDLPKNTAVICTSNKKVADLDARFQTRFQVFTLQPPAPDEIAKLLRRFLRRQDDVRRISNLCCGNVRLALFDAQSVLDEMGVAA